MFIELCMNKTKKIFLLLLGIVISLVLLNVGLTQWVESRLPELINNKNNTAYQITYKDIDLSIWNSKIIAHQVTISPKTSLEDLNKKLGLYGSIEYIEIAEFDIWSILFGEKIKATNLLVSKPMIVLYKIDDKAIDDHKSINSKIVDPLKKTIIVSNLFLNNGNLKILNNANNKIIVNVSNINFKLEGIVLNETTINQKVPISYKKYFLVCDSLFYRPNAFYEFQSNQLTATEKGLTLKNFQMIPTLSRKEFVKKIPKEKDLYTILAEAISINKMDWGFKNETFFFKTNSIVINKAAANIYRSKMPADDLSKKKLYNELLRNLDADIKVDSLQIKDSFLTYEEQKSFEEKPGKLFFSNFNMLVQGIESGYKKSSLPDVKINVNCSFMKKSPLNLDWSFNVLDKTEGFKIKGSVFKFDTEALAAFTKPYNKIKVTGELKEVYFNFVGNDLANNGTFSIKYDDLAIEIYQDDKQVKKNIFLSAIGNLFVKNDSDEELKTTQINVERNQAKSFYNFLWISVADGLKQILL